MFKLCIKLFENGFLFGFEEKKELLNFMATTRL